MFCESKARTGVALVGLAVGAYIIYSQFTAYRADRLAHEVALDTLAARQQVWEHHVSWLRAASALREAYRIGDATIADTFYTMFTATRQMPNIVKLPPGLPPFEEFWAAVSPDFQQRSMQLAANLGLSSEHAIEQIISGRVPAMRSPPAPLLTPASSFINSAVLLLGADIAVWMAADSALNT